ncbi:MAG: hypothetical protein KGZ91_21315 [Afipia sp.]|nr:hypothetical protein [Afipia sp.]
MKNVLIVILLTSVIALASVLGLVLQDTEQPNSDLDRDMTRVRAEIVEARRESEKYSSGLVKSFIDLRLSVLQATDAMLDQKRRSLFWRISLRYPNMASAARVAPDQELTEILDELRQAEDRANQARTEAARYSGGLVQSMSLARVAIDDVAISQLRLKFYSAKHGFPILTISAPKANDSATKGKIVQDRDGL